MYNYRVILIDHRHPDPDNICYITDETDFRYANLKFAELRNAMEVCTSLYDQCTAKMQRKIDGGEWEDIKEV